MATNKENLERWLLIRALVDYKDIEKIGKIADKMILELEDHKDE